MKIRNEKRLTGTKEKKHDDKLVFYLIPLVLANSGFVLAYIVEDNLMVDCLFWSTTIIIISLLYVILNTNK